MSNNENRPELEMVEQVNEVARDRARGVGGELGIGSALDINGGVGSVPSLKKRKDSGRKRGELTVPL